MTTREAHYVELVGADGTPSGTATVEDAHQAPGRLHRAFSVFLRDPEGRVLMQQRAAVKTRFPSRWANTCCGHPAPGEDLAVAAVRRLGEELGLGPVPLTAIGVYSYYAEDPATGRVEYEYDHVLLGELPVGWEPQPDPAEVADLRWVAVPDLLAALAAQPRAYAPWLAGVTGRLAEHLAGPGSKRPRGRPAAEASRPAEASERSGGR